MQIKTELGNTSSEYEKEKLQERLARLAGGVAVIKVGAATETEMKEKKFKIEDALNATKAAVEEGIVAGGGAALAKIAPRLEEFSNSVTPAEKIGVMIIRRAIEAPLKQIALNAGLSDSAVLAEVQKTDANTGFDFAGFDSNNWKSGIKDLIVAGIIDPLKVTRTALQNAASVAGELLTTEAVVVDKPEPKQASNMPNPMGGMDY